MSRHRFLNACLIIMVSISGCSKKDAPTTAAADEPAADWPVATVQPYEMSAHGHNRIDNYYWLRDDDREDPRVLAYLEAENQYTHKRLAHTEALQERLYHELIGRIKQTDASVPVRLDDYWYYVRYAEGKEHEVYARRTGSPDGADEILLDVNDLAAAYDYYDIGETAISPDHRLLAYTEDTVSRGEYVIRIKNLETGALLPDAIPMTEADLAWANDNEHLYYIKLQEGTLIPYRIYRHRLGTDAVEDVLLYEEADNTFGLTLYKSRSKDWIVAESVQTLSTETLLLDANDPEGELRAFLPRERNHEYEIETTGDKAFIRTNWEAENFRLMRVPLATSTDKSTWEEIVAHRDDVYIEDFTVFDDYLVIEERHDGILKLRVMPFGDGESYYIESDEEAYTAEIDDNPNLDTSMLRYAYTSLATPETIYDLDMATGEKRLRKQQEVVGDFDRANYVTRRVHATARDGALIPVTLLHRKDITNDGTRPLYILAYGSYGHAYDPEFRAERLTLVDRGIVFALAHTRGGQELGRQWYENGKLLNKKNTFTDYIDVTEYLLERRWGHPEKVIAMGRSAGGLLMGTAVNMRPELYKVMVTEVPFVDVITTMLDESIPLTTFEFDEWGNPEDKAYYDYMLSYSPYDQIEAQGYPHILVTAGLWDPAVQYWEPAKWVAKLRATKTDDNMLLLYTDMDAGHRGASGRFERMRDRAREYAFIFDVLGIEN